MEIPRPQDPSSPSSPSSTSSSSSSSSSSTAPRAPPPPPPPSQPLLPPSPKPIPRTIETTPYPTTFVQADTTSFKQVVQMLTGAAETSKFPGKSSTNHASQPSAAAAAARATAPKRPAFKLYERRSSMKNLKMISPIPTAPIGGGAAGFLSPRKQPEILSPSVLDFPSLVLSPVTPLIPDPFNRSPRPPPPLPPPAAKKAEEEERAAIAEKGFFLHPSPRGAEPPRLLPLFPVTSPRVSSSSSD